MAVSPLDGRHHHAAVWDGKEMIVWGGEHPPSVLGDGATYDPKTNTWKEIATGPLSPRTGASAVWTGSKMIVFGGVDDRGDSQADGAAYAPTTNSWKKIATGPLGPRRDHRAVWTGKEMIVVGGSTPVFGPPTAASYDPIADTWSSVPEPPIDDLAEFILAWVGTHVVAVNGSLTAPAAAVYDPASKKWTSLPALAAARYHAGVAVTGTSLFLYGGLHEASSAPFFASSGDGLLLSEATWGWAPVPAPPSAVLDNPARIESTTWCVGTRCYVWSGGIDDESSTFALTAGGAAYDTADGTWSKMSSVGEPSPRGLAPALWTGELAIIWGGQKNAAPASDGAVYVP